MRSVLSIVTPAYNAGKFIEQMIESVLIQPEQVELIIVNDGSTDETEDVCEKYTNIYKVFTAFWRDTKLKWNSEFRKYETKVQKIFIWHHWESVKGAV